MEFAIRVVTRRGLFVETLRFYDAYYSVIKTNKKGLEFNTYKLMRLL